MRDTVKLTYSDEQRTYTTTQTDMRHLIKLLCIINQYDNLHLDRLGDLPPAFYEQLDRMDTPTQTTIHKLTCRETPADRWRSEE